MSLRTRTVLLITGLLAASVLATTAAQAWAAQRAIVAQTESDAALIAHLLARSARYADSVPTVVEAEIGKHMIVESTILAHLVAIAEELSFPPDKIKEHLAAIARDSEIDDIWITDESGHIYLGAADLDFTFRPDQSQAGAFWPVLTGEVGAFIQETRVREIDSNAFKYAAVRGVDKPRIVQVGMDAAFLHKLREEAGLARMGQEIVAEGQVLTFLILDRDLQSVASSVAPGQTATSPPLVPNESLLRSVMNEGRATSYFAESGLTVVTAIPSNQPASPSGVLILTLPTDQLVAALREQLFLTGLVGIGVLCLGVLGAFVLANNVTQPVNALTTAVGAIEAGTYAPATLIEVTQRKDELGQLASALGTYARLSAEHEEQAARYTRELESEVEIRTRDLTAATAAAEGATGAIAKQQERLQHILDSAPVGVGISTDGIIRFANPCLTQMSNVQVGDLGSSLFIHPEDRDHLLEILARERVVTEFATEVYGSDGGARHILATFFYTDYDDQEGILGWLVDVSELKRAEKVLVEAKELAEEAAKTKADFLANMSHEIRTPMNAILGMTHLVLRTSLDPRQQDYVTKIQQSGQHLLGIINDILDFSKIEAGKLAVESTPFEIDQVLRNMSSLVAEKAADKGLELIVDVDPSLPATLRGDPLRLGQILINLCNNAVKFTEQGDITVSVRVQEQTDRDVVVLFSVADTGIGMAADDVKRLFQAFQQADVSITRKYGGTGLGLAISKRLAELMGGSIGVTSEVGTGSTFWFTSRLDRVEGAAPPRKRVADIKDRRVLVIDDNTAARMVLTQMLLDLTLRVEEASSGELGIEMIDSASARGEPFEVVFIDWQMPGIDGIETAHRLRSHTSPDGSTSLILITAYGREEVFPQAGDAGFKHVLVKPIAASTLYETILEALGQPSDEGDSIRQPLLTEELDLETIRGARLLLVEDNELNQEVALGLLEDAALVVDVAQDGEIAVRMVHEHEYDAVLMDMQMPVMDGITATKIIRSEPPFASMPIIAMTANAMTSDREACLAAGMNDHLAKPIDPDGLMRVLLRWVHPRSPEADGSRVRAPVAAKETVLSSPRDSVPEIDGVDTRSALKRMGGKTDRYLSLLRKFADQQAGAAEEIRRTLASGDRESAQRAAHTIKGVAANLGVTTLAATAEVVESAIKNGQDADEAIQTLAGSLGVTIQAIHAALPLVEASADAVGTRAEAETLLARLKELLENDDGAAAELIFEARPTLASVLTEADTDRLAAFVEDFDYPAALAALSEIESRQASALE